MRGLVPGLDSPSPLLLLLPGVYQDSDFTSRFVAAFDDALAPVFSTLDNLEAHFRPETAPADLLAFVGTWVGANRDDRTSLPTQRRAVAGAALAHRRRGTARGLVRAIEHLTGGEVEVSESGATAWATTCGGSLPGALEPYVHVRITVADSDAVDLEVVDATVAEVLPPHVVHEVEVVVR